MRDDICDSGVCQGRVDMLNRKLMSQISEVKRETQN